METQSNKQLTTKSLFERVDVRKKFEEMLGKKAQGFMTSVLQVVSANTMLKDAEPTSVYQAAATAATLDLPINNNLGFAYIVPYKNKIKGENGQPDRWATVAQFQMGYKGFIQLAQRSGQFKTISAAPIYEGQLIAENPLTGFVFDFTKKTSNNIIGYAGYFALINGFEKIHYMTKDELQKHGTRFSQTYKKGFGLWKDDFDGMALKTVIKLLLSKYAPLSIEMQRAVISDQALIRDAETNDVEYVDADAIVVDKEEERLRLMIGDASTTEDLYAISVDIPADNETLQTLFTARKIELENAA